jgi:hypothetical protein
MLNPSVAGKKPSDPTMDNVNLFTKEWGFDGCIVVNLYPFVSSTQDKLSVWRQSQIDTFGIEWTKQSEEMRNNLVQIAEAGQIAIWRVAAFGGSIEKEDREWVRECVKHFERPSNPSDAREGLTCLGYRNGTYPAHPKPWKHQPIPQSARECPGPWDKRPSWLTL